MPIANILIILFLLAMVYWWALQGFFSAFLHLVLVVLAATFTLAFWETLAFTGMQWQPGYAWGLWLLGPFVLILIVLRVLSDKLVKKNVQLPNLISNLLGGICGAASGVLTAGLTIIGLGFLPLGADLGGVRPLAVSAGGGVEQTGSDLWLPVDRWTNSFLTSLGAGSFSTATPLGEYQPQLAHQAALFRMRYDENASVVAVPGSVEVSSVVTAPAPVEGVDPEVAEDLGPAAESPANQIVVVETNWYKAPGTYDPDSALRVPPTQIRLATQPQGRGDEVTLHAPVAFIHQDGENRYFRAFSAADISAFGSRQEETFAWTFLIPADQQPRFLLVRHTRLSLPRVRTDPAAVAAALGEPMPEQQETQPQAQAGGGESQVGPREGIQAGHVATGLEITDRLPSEISKNYAPDLETIDGGIMSGTANVSKAPGALSQTTRINRVWVNDSFQRAVRLELGQDRAQSLLGKSRVAAASLQGVWLTTARGGTYQPIGYVWQKAGGEQEIRIDRDQPIRSAQQLPVPQMGGNDHLYLYFVLPQDSTIVSYNIGGSTQQEIQPPLVVR